MPTLNGSMPYDRGPEHPCIWCGQPTDITFIPEFRLDLGPQPMHMFCAAALIRAYERMRAGHILDGQSVTRLRRLAAMTQRHIAPTSTSSST